MARAGGERTPALVFTTSGCKHCKKAKALLKENHVEFREVDVQVYPGLLEELISLTEWKTVPQVFLQGNFIGGASDLESLIQEGKLSECLQSTETELPQGILNILEKMEVYASRGEESETEGYDFLGGIKRTEFERALRLRSYGKRITKGIASFASEELATGEEIVEWMVRNLDEVKTSEQAVELGREMQLLGLINHKTYSNLFGRDKEKYRTLWLEEGPKSAGLNTSCYWTLPSRPAAVVAEELRTKIASLYDLALSDDGSSVDYGLLRDSAEFQEFVEATEELQNVDLFGMSVNEKKAFFINIYNALVIHAMVVKGPPSTFLERLFFFTNTKYCIGGQPYSLDDMENGVLRGNRAPASSLLNTRPFSNKDPRRFHTILPNDPRIHFALVCGAKSCPPIKIFNANNLEKGLDAATASFLEGEVEIDEETSTVTLSKILDWYSEDFGDNNVEKLKWILLHLSEGSQGKLQRVLYGTEFKIKYRKYNWETNSK